jgi:hypothetical protein
MGHSGRRRYIEARSVGNELVSCNISGIFFIRIKLSSQCTQLKY